MLAVSRGDVGGSWLAVSDRALLASAPLAALAVAARAAFGGQGQVGSCVPACARFASEPHHRLLFIAASDQSSSSPLVVQQPCFFWRLRHSTSPLLLTVQIRRL